MSLLFSVQEIWVRILLVCVAAATDCLDGYFARAWGQQSRLGVFLDPLADKIFVFTGVFYFWREGQLNGVAASLFFAREGVLLWFMGYLLWKGQLGKFTIRSVWSGKVITTLQFLFFLALSAGHAISVSWSVVFVPLAWWMGMELWWAAHAPLAPRGCLGAGEREGCTQSVMD